MNRCLGNEVAADTGTTVSITFIADTVTAFRSYRLAGTLILRTDVMAGKMASACLVTS